MLNILKSDFYRLFRSRAFYICTIVASGLMMLGAFISKWLMEQVAEQMSTTSELPFDSGLEYGLMAFADSDVSLYMAILISIFVTAEFAHGTMKNTISKGFSKINVYISKLITMTVATYILMLAMFVAGLFSAAIVTGNLGSSVGTIETFGMIGIEMLLRAALASLYVMIAMIIRSNGGTIAISIIGVITFGPIIFQLLDVVFKKSNTFIKYSLQNNINSFSDYMSRTSDDFIRAIIVSVVYLAITTALGIFAFKETDVK